MGFIKRLLRREQKSNPIPPMPSWDKIVEIMYDKGLNCFSGQVINVLYSEDKTLRYVVIKDERGILTYHLEAIYQFDEDEWKYVSQHDEALPAMWECQRDGYSRLFASEDDLMKELEAEPEFQQYFIKN